MTIADSSQCEDQEDLAPANLGPLYQNQEEDPEVANLMTFCWDLPEDELPDLPEIE